jgi:flavin reductase (DIM6/NTAB) family NADH-FMN oxidoreductase RutF
VSGVEKPNVMTADWVIPVSFEPQLLAVSVGHTRYTNALIKECGEFVVSVPTVELLKDVWAAGTVSGSKVNKLEKLSLTFVDSRKVRVPSIKECQANLECRVFKEVEAGDHTLFIGEILHVTAGDAFKDGRPDIENYRFILHSGFGKNFTTNSSDRFSP